MGSPSTPATVTASIWRMQNLAKTAAFTGLCCLLATGCLFGGGEDDGNRQLGLNKVVTEFQWAGAAMQLVAYRSNDGVCVEVQNARPPHNAGGGCGFPVPEPEALSVSVGEQQRGVLVDGPVAKRVDDVRVELAGGREVDAGPFGDDAGFEVNFFVAALPPGSRVVAVTATDADGKVVERDEVQPFPVSDGG